MSRTISRGTCSVRPGNQDLSYELYPIYHAFVSPANLTNIMKDIAYDHPEISRFDPQLMRNLAEEVYANNSAAQAAEGRVRKSNALLAGEVKRLNEVYKWPLLRQMAADWAPAVRYDFLYKEGELLGSRPIYSAGKEEGMGDDLIQNRLALASDPNRCYAAEIPLTRWPVQDAASAPPTFATPNPMPSRGRVDLGARGNAPGRLDMAAQVGRVLPGPVALELSTHRNARR